MLCERYVMVNYIAKEDNFFAVHYRNLPTNVVVIMIF